MDASTAQSLGPSDAAAVSALYTTLLRHWNERDAVAFAACFIEAGAIIGYDGSTVDGREEIARHLGGIFAQHQTPSYVSKVQRIDVVSDGAIVLRGIVGMATVPTTSINPALNAIQTLVACKREGEWRVALFQNTPAQFHGRPDLVAEMTAELQRVLDGD